MPSGRFGLEIRAAVAADAPGVAELMRAGGLDLAPRVVAERLEALRAEPGAVLVAGEWGPPAGLLALTWRRTLQSASPIARVTTLLVAPDDRRRGIGRLLLKSASQAARAAGCGTLELAVPQDLPDLRAFCETTGFAPAGALFTRSLRKQS